MKINKKDTNLMTAALLAILFVKNEPVKISKLTNILGLGKEEIGGILNNLEEKLNEDWSGITIVKNGDSILLTTKPFLADVLGNLFKVEMNEDLTKAALETLSIILYFGPISRSKIDYVRGVNSTYILRSLLIRGLIERKIVGGQYIYEASFDLLKYLGVINVEELPNYAERNEFMSKFFSDYFTDSKKSSKIEINRTEQ